MNPNTNQSTRKRRKERNTSDKAIKNLLSTKLCLLALVRFHYCSFATRNEYIEPVEYSPKSFEEHSHNVFKEKLQII